MVRACETVAPLIAHRAHTLETRFRRGELWLDADPTRIEQIVVNLLANAARYTRPNGHIWLDAHTEGEEVIIQIRDTGIGISPEKIPQMFELFTQGERSTARTEGGLGIGLTVVRGLCELHGGSVSATSPGHNQGSTFVVRLPAAQAPSEMDGYEVARRLRTEAGCAETLLVALTGYGQEEDRARARDSGFDFHMVKPIDVDQLTKLLSENLTG